MIQFDEHTFELVQPPTSCVFFLFGKTTTLLLFASESHISASSVEVFHPKKFGGLKKTHEDFPFGCHSFFLGGGAPKTKRLNPSPCFFSTAFFSKQKKNPMDQSTEGSDERKGRFANQGPLVLLPWPCWPWQGPWIVLPRSKVFFSQILGDSLTQLSQGRCGPRRRNKGDIVETQNEKFQKDLASPIFLVESDRNIKR